MVLVLPKVSPTPCLLSPEWKKTVGTGKAVQYPVGIGGKGNSGVAGTIQNQPRCYWLSELWLCEWWKVPTGCSSEQGRKLCKGKC